MTDAPPIWRDGPILAFMIAETLVWAAIFYSFPAMVLQWQAEFGWSATAALGAFSLALGLQGLAAPWVGRAIDRELVSPDLIHELRVQVLEGLVRCPGLGGQRNDGDCGCDSSHCGSPNPPCDVEQHSMVMAIRQL